MSRIERQVHLDAAPMTVAAQLASSPWRSAYRIEPVGAGSRVDIAAEVEPEGLARAIEAAALAEVCALRSHSNENPSLVPHHRRSVEANPKNQVPRTESRRTTMTTITRHVTVDAPSDRVWLALADFGGIATWNPNVKASKLTSSRDEGEGITRECRLTPMGTVQERVTEWTDGSMMTIEIFEFKNVPAMRHAVAVLSLDPRGDKTGVTMQMTYEVGLGAVGAGMNAMMMKRQFSAAVTSLLAGLKFHVETGRPVERDSDLQLQAVVAA